VDACAECGASQREAAQFCRSCGAHLSGGSGVSSISPPPLSVEGSKRQLALALGSYAALFCVSLGLLVSDAVPLNTLRWLDLCLVMLALTAMQLASRHSAHVPSLRAALRWPIMSGRLAGVLLAGTAAGLVAAELLGILFVMDDSFAMEVYREAGQGLAVALADYSLLTPILEESLFRGLILGALLSVVGRKAALWGSALMFASAHLTPVTFVHHTILGLVCGHARLETKSLLIPMLIHGVYNAIVVGRAW
jgi:membrane protease YdiL (CAAX protease family)